MKIKKILCGILALAMSVSLLAGCGGDEEIAEVKRKVEEKDVETEVVDEVLAVEMIMEPGEGTHITKDVFEPTLLLWGYNFDKMNVFQEAFKYTNVKPEAFIADTADATQAFDLMLIGDDMPDIAVSSVSKINAAGVSGAFYPLDKLIEEYAPNIKAYFEAHPEIKAECIAEDGNLYVIPTTYDSLVSEGFFIRQDWLDKLGLEVPTTVEEYHQVLLAFKNNDPNDNGKADEIPFFQRAKSYLSLAQLWGAYHRNYVDDNGKVRNGRLESEFKVAMQNIIQWKNEGLIDPEILTRNNAREALLGTNVGGSTHDWFSSTGSFTKNIREGMYADKAWAQKFDFAPIAPPADINGDVKEIYSRPLMRGQGWGITATNEYVVETIKYMDWWFTEQGKLAYWYGMEGEDYKMVGGEPVFTDKVLEYPIGIPMYMREQGQLEQGAPMSMEAEMAGMTENSKKGFAMYESSVDIKPQFPTLPYTVDESDEVERIQAELNVHLEETIAMWYAGDQPLNDSTWNEYIEEAESMGSDRLLEIQQAAYDRLVARGGGLNR